MAFYLLSNVAGYYGDPNTNAGLSLTTSSGYSVNSFISGPRSTWHRSDSSSLEIGRGYVYPELVDPTFCVVARADKLLTQAGTRVRPRQLAGGSSTNYWYSQDWYSGGSWYEHNWWAGSGGSGTWSYISGVDYNPLVAGDLIGPRSQDLVFAVEPTETGGIGLSCKPVSGSQATLLSKFYGCEAFEFDNPPQLGTNWSDQPPGTFARTMRGTYPYEIERRFSIRFGPETRAKAIAFRSVKYMFNYWPLFLYDPSATIWDHKLEHVIIEGVTETIIENNRHVLDISFARLRHYE